MVVDRREAACGNVYPLRSASMGSLRYVDYARYYGPFTVPIPVFKWVIYLVQFLEIYLAEVLTIDYV